MSSDLGTVYQKAFKEYKVINSGKTPGQCQDLFNDIWRKKVTEISKSNDMKLKAANVFLNELREKASVKKRAQDISGYFKPLSYSATSHTDTTDSSSTFNQNISEGTQQCHPTSSKNNFVAEQADENSSELSTQSSKDLRTETVIKKKTPVQDALNNEIYTLQVNLNAALLKKNAGLCNDDLKEDIKKLQADLEQKRKRLQQLQRNAVRQKKHRDEKKQSLSELKVNHPNLVPKLKIRGKVGRPTIEEDQPELLKTIVKIATFGASTDERRRCDVLHSCRTLDDLQKELVNIGFQISRSGLYLRILPRSASSNEGKKHINTVPVRLAKAQNNLHKSHIDQNFCTATIRAIETIASILGSEQCIVLSQDDKARIPLGITAANKQGPILMHFDYPIRLPDHDWVIAERHKLVPSVYAVIVIEPNKMGYPDAVSYSGPTYVAIRSGKHSSSTASSHAADFERLLKIECCKDFMFNSNQKVKPVVILSVDGGPDENPRYTKVIAHAIDHFSTHDLDGIFIFTNAPGRSAFNRVERRMAPLSRELSGVILEHDHFGTHLNESGKTIDEELEKRNFQYAGSCLVDRFSKMEIDGYAVCAEYIEPGEQLSNPQQPSASWYERHVRESQYFLQVVKCLDTSCCKPMRSGLRTVLQNGFLPPPYALKQTSTGPVIVEPDAKGCDNFTSLLLRNSLDLKVEDKRFEVIPYDYYCPSVRKDLLGRICDVCGIYFASKKGVKTHKAEIHKKLSKTSIKTRPKRIVARRDKELLCHISNHEGEVEVAEWHNEEDVEVQGLSIPSDDIEDTPFPQVENLDDWLNPTFEDI